MASVGIDRNYYYISSNTIKLLHVLRIMIAHIAIRCHRILHRGFFNAQLNVSFKNCTAGLQLKGGHCSFIGNYGPFLRFNSSSGYAEIFRGYWIGRPDGKSQWLYCLFCNEFSSRNSSGGVHQIPQTSQTDNSECSVSRRRGFLCSECNDNLSLSIFSVDKQSKQPVTMA